jgi:hypothetical protein
MIRIKCRYFIFQISFKHVIMSCKDHTYYMINIVTKEE